MEKFQKMTHRITNDLKRISFENYENCINCKRIFSEGDTAHLGYSKQNIPLYVCDECSHLLHETAVRQHFTPRPYEVPKPSAQLWRYMDFSKYVSLLMKKGLYFARSDTFEDVFEGAKGLKKNKERWDRYYSYFFRQAIENPPENYKIIPSNSDIEKESQRLLKELQQSGQSRRQFTFINCWHENDSESEAMWRLYSNYFKNAIAINTTFSKLYASTGCNPSIDIGRVKYIDFEKSYAGINDSFWRKRKSFEHEKEVRAILIDCQCQDRGKFIPCDLSVLIEKVFVSPISPDWFADMVYDVTNKYGLNIKVSRSQLNEEPFF